MPTKAQRAKMTEEQVQHMKAQQREYMANLSPEHKERIRQRNLSKNLTAKQRERRKSYHRDQWHKMPEGPEKELRKKRAKERTKEWYKNMTDEQKIRRRDLERERVKRVLENMTEEQKEQLRQNVCKNNRKYRAKLTDEELMSARDVSREWRKNRTAFQYEALQKKNMHTSAIMRGKKHGVPCTITLDDIYEIWPDDNCCPMLGVPFQRGKGRPHDSSPNLDRKVPKDGYVVGNIQVISQLANRIKTNATGAEILAVGKCVLEDERERAST